jgi:hypothetical protein
MCEHLFSDFPMQGKGEALFDGVDCAALSMFTEAKSLRAFSGCSATPLHI